jgi:hypothetical protein
MSYTLKWDMLAGEETIREAMKKLKAAAIEIKGLAQTKCPVDIGTLRDSAYVSELEDGYEIGFGGAAESYALEQHENLQYHHDVGEAKFLEKAFMEVTARLKGKMATE